MKGIKQCLWAFCFSGILIAFSLYISLDTFVIGRIYQSNAVDMNTAMFGNQVSAIKKEATEEAGEVSENTAENTRNDNDVSTQAQQENRQTEQTADDQTEKTDARQEHRAFDQYSSSGRKNDQEFGPSGGRASRGGRSPFGSESNSAAGVDPSAAYTGDTTYQDDHVAITLKEYNQNNTKIYVAEVTMKTAQFLKTAFANNTYGKNVVAATSVIAQANNAILAINGDYYGARETGYVIRNGIVYRSSAAGKDVLCVYADGTMEIVNDRDFTADQLAEKNVWQAFSFGPALIKNGSVTVETNTEVGRGMVSNPRTAIGVIDANHYVFVVSDGRTEESEGLSLYELAQFMQGLGIRTAYNLDGGGSSTMYFNGQVVNNPTTTGHIQERSVSDIVYIGKNT